MLPAPRVRLEERVAAESVILTEEELAWSGDRGEMRPPLRNPQSMLTTVDR